MKKMMEKKKCLNKRFSLVKMNIHLYIIRISYYHHSILHSLVSIRFLIIIIILSLFTLFIFIMMQNFFPPDEKQTNLNLHDS